ncbi:unnamed protein product, partial [Prorocentrum cordatum]
MHCFAFLRRCGPRAGTPPPPPPAPSGDEAGAEPQRGRVTCFGEAMIRYIPDSDEGPDPSPFASRWLQSAGGAELNVTVALARLGWPGHLARWVSVVPRGALGDHFLSLLAQAYPDGKGEGNLSMVRREEGDVGIYHVWPAKHKLWYQRHRSAFGLMDPAWFGAAFWAEILQEPAPGGGPAVLQLTGITAQITQSTRAAWQNALAAAAAHKRAGWRVVTVLDINHRPALGPWEDLWALIEPHTSALTSSCSRPATSRIWKPASRCRWCPPIRGLLAGRCRGVLAALGRTAAARGGDRRRGLLAVGHDGRARGLDGPRVGGAALGRGDVAGGHPAGRHARHPEAEGGRGLLQRGARRAGRGAAGPRGRPWGGGVRPRLAPTAPARCPRA